MGSDDIDRANFFKTEMEFSTLLSRPALFSMFRIDKSTVPGDLYQCELGSDGDTPNSVSKNAGSNFYASVILFEPIKELEDSEDATIPISYSDWSDEILSIEDAEFLVSCLSKIENRCSSDTYIGASLSYSQDSSSMVESKIFTIQELAEDIHNHQSSKLSLSGFVKFIEESNLVKETIKASS